METGLAAPTVGAALQSSRANSFLNEELFLYFEELDLARRLRPPLRLGWCRDALIVHAGGGSSGAHGERRTANAEYHSTLSALKFTALYHPGRLWVTVPARFLAKSVQLMSTGQGKLLSSVTGAYRDFFKWRRALKQARD